MATSKRKVNAELEKLREDATASPSVVHLVAKLKEHTSSVHVSYLFSRNTGLKILKTLCLYLSATKTSHVYSNWEELGIRLEVDHLVIRCIKYNNFMNEDPTYNLFLTYAQKENATISNVVNALYEIKRYDIISQVAKLILEIPVKIFDFNTKYLLKAPFVLSSIDDDSKNVEPFSSEKVSQDNFKCQYAKTIFLTYAKDASEIVKTLLIKLRTPRNNLKLGVITLDENSSTVFSNPELYIQERISQVDYVIPILSKEYLSILSNNSPILESAIESLDHKYVRYVYTLMNTLYLRNGCRNTKVRCVIPNNVFNEVQHHPLMINSIFQIWIQETNVDVLVDRLIA